MRSLPSIVRSLEAAMETGNGHTLASAVQELLPLLKPLADAGSLCWDQEWDWWLKLPPAQRGAMVKHYKALVEGLA